MYTKTKINIVISNEEARVISDLIDTLDNTQLPLSDDDYLDIIREISIRSDDCNNENISITYEN